VLFQFQFCLFGKLLDDDRGPVRRISTGLGELFAELFDGDLQNAAHQQRVQIVDLPRGDHQVVGLLALDEEFAVAVIDLSARRVLDHVPQYVIGCICLVGIVEDLDIEQPQQDNHSNK